jgi:hypothetical protein
VLDGFRVLLQEEVAEGEGGVGEIFHRSSGLLLTHFFCL